MEDRKWPFRTALGSTVLGCLRYRSGLIRALNALNIRFTNSDEMQTLWNERQFSFLTQI
jgi:hypothetical protein